MIDQALTLITAKLNGHLAGRFASPEDIVVLAPLTDAEGKPADATRNRLALFITNIAEDAVPRNSKRRGASVLGQNTGPEALHLDVYAMLAASYDTNIYAEGLKMLSSALMYIQTYPVLTPQNTPEMPKGLQQLSLEISNLKVEESSQLWGNLGGRYVPSVMLKIRTVTLASGAITSVTPTIRKPAAKATPDRART